MRCLGRALPFAMSSLLCALSWAGDGAGVATIAPNDGLIVGQPYSFTITYTYREPKVEATEGRFGQAVIFDEAALASFGSAQVLSVREGTVELWVRPEWAGDDGQTHRFFDCFRQERNRALSNRIQLSKMANGELRFQIYAREQIHDADFDVSGVFKPGEWHHLAGTWRTIDADAGRMESRLYLDGKQVAHSEFSIGKGPVALDPSFSLGRADLGQPEAADAAIDEVRVLNRWSEPAQLATTGPPSPGPGVTFIAHLDGDLAAYSAGVEIGKGMRPGGGLQIAIPRTWTRPQNQYPRDAGYVTATASDGTGVDLYFGDYPNIEWYIHAVIGGDTLADGEQIKVVYGDQRFGGPGGFIQPFPQDRWTDPRNHLAIHSDTDGDGSYAELPPENRYGLRILAQPASFFHMAAPSIIRPGEDFALAIVAFDQYRNGANPPFRGEIRLTAPDGVRVPASANMGRSDGNHVRVEGLRIDRPGVYTVRASGGEVTGESNPIVCVREAPDFRLYWGDIHVHTAMSDGLLTADECYVHGRDLSALDFAAKTDHAESTTPEKWEETVAAAERYNDPGRFVALCGYEWTSSFGHRNVYTPDPDMPYYGSGDPRADTLPKFFSRLRDHGVETIAIPHALLSAMKWDDYDPAVSMLMEIYSMWGGGELRNNSLWDKGQPGMSAREILATGAKMGFIGSSDTHDGRPGRTNALSRFTNLNHRGGLAAVRAEELTRRSLFDALKARRTYATTGERIYLDFRAGEHLMGEEFASGDGPVLAAHVVSTDDLVAVEIIRNGRVIYANQPKGREAKFEFRDNDPPPTDCYYYLRARQADGAVAWASPVWVRAAE